MSKYELCETKISEQQVELLKEAMAVVWKEHYKIDLKESEIEYHKNAVTMIGYDGSIRDKNHPYGEAKANLIVRGPGSQRIEDIAKSKLKITGPNRMPSAYNDFGFILENGVWKAQIQDYDSANIHQVIKLVEVYVAALKFVKNFSKMTELNPNIQIFHNDQPVTEQEMLKIVSEAIQHGKEKPKFKIKAPKTKIDYSTLTGSVAPITVAPKPEAKAQQKEKTKERRGRNR